MVLWVTQRPHCPTLCPVGHAHENSQGDGDFRGLRCLEVEGDHMSALYKEGFPGVGARRCLQKCGRIVPAHHRYWNSTVGTSICRAGGGKAEMEEAADIARCVPAHKPVV